MAVAAYIKLNDSPTEKGGGGGATIKGHRCWETLIQSMSGVQNILLSFSQGRRKGGVGVVGHFLYKVLGKRSMHLELFFL